MDLTEQIELAKFIKRTTLTLQALDSALSKSNPEAHKLFSEIYQSYGEVYKEWETRLLNERPIDPISFAVSD